MNNEWQVDEHGQRFRKIGDIIEYEMEFAFPHVTRDEGKEAQERKEAQEKENRLHTGKDCPFMGGLNTECLTDCALYGKTACALAMKETPPNKDTSGRKCPIYGKKCNERCALYFNGCGLINIIKCLKAGKEK